MERSNKKLFLVGAIDSHNAVKKYLEIIITSSTMSEQCQTPLLANCV